MRFLIIFHNNKISLYGSRRRHLNIKGTHSEIFFNIVQLGLRRINSFTVRDILGRAKNKMK